MKFSNLKGAKTLSAKAQKSINGGKKHCGGTPYYACPEGQTCVYPTNGLNGYCVMEMPNNI